MRWEINWDNLCRYAPSAGSSLPPHGGVAAAVVVTEGPGSSVRRGARGTAHHGAGAEVQQDRQGLCGEDAPEFDHLSANLELFPQSMNSGEKGQTRSWRGRQRIELRAACGFSCWLLMKHPASVATTSSVHDSQKPWRRAWDTGAVPGQARRAFSTQTSRQAGQGLSVAVVFSPVAEVTDVAGATGVGSRMAGGEV